MKELKKFTLLCVEDDESVREIYKDLFSLLFKEVFFAKNGKEGLELFEKYRPDIVLTDEKMPVMSGLEMIREIRKKNKSVPVILVTAFDDNKLLKTSIDLHITAYVKKPINKENIIGAFEKAVKYVISDKILFNKQNEKIKYKDYQEKMAYEKEKKIIKTDIGKSAFFDMEIFYSPLDITSGDSFSVRDSCIFLVDAMGKGLSASITAMISTSFFNYLKDKKYAFEDLINEFKSFIIKNMTDYEVLACGFYYFEEEFLHYATFGLPAFLVQKDEVVKFKSNNPPLASYIKKINISKISLKGVKKILIFSDGLSENFTTDKKLYLNYLNEDFKNSTSLNEFETLRASKIQKQEDDITYFYLKG